MIEQHDPSKKHGSELMCSAKEKIEQHDPSKNIEVDACAWKWTERKTAPAPLVGRRVTIT